MPTDTPAAKAARKTAAKPADEKPEAEKGTGYVIFDQATRMPEDDSVLRDAIAGGRVWVERPGLYRATRGDEAIKRANRQPDGSHAPGNFKAVPGSTWNAEANNLTILAETKVVNTFVKPNALPLANGNGKAE